MKRENRFYLTDAFTLQPFSGNPAGVVIEDSPYTDESRLKIAKEVGASETAFAEFLDREELMVRYYTPVEEVPLCGHATIALFWTLGTKEYLHPLERGVKTVPIHTGAGKISVELTYEEGKLVYVSMTQGKPQIFQQPDRKKAAKVLGIDVEDIGLPGKDTPVEVLSTGIKDIFIPVKNRRVLSSITKDNLGFTAWAEEEDAYSLHVFTEEEGIWFQRNFCPRLGIDEEAATGTSTAALLYYLKHHQVIDGDEIKAIQGVEMNRPSEIYGTLQGGELRIGGKGAIVVEGMIYGE